MANKVQAYLDLARNVVDQTKSAVHQLTDMGVELRTMVGDVRRKLFTKKAADKPEEEQPDVPAQ